MSIQKTFCQSCGMPLESQEVLGTNADGSLNIEYCVYCYKDGAYTEECTMQQMIDISLEHMNEMFGSDPNYNAEAALREMQEYY